MLGLIVVLAAAIQLYRYVAKGEVQAGPLPIQEAQTVLATISELIAHKRLPEARDRCESLLSSLPEGPPGTRDSESRAEVLLRLKSLQAQGLEIADRPALHRTIGPEDVAGGADSLRGLATRPLRVTGRGYAPPGAPPGPAGLLAERAAVLDAYRALLVELRGVHINERVTVADLVVQTELRTSVDGTIRGARQLATRRLGDGRVEVDLVLEGEALADALRTALATSR